MDPLVAIVIFVAFVGIVGWIAQGRTGFKPDGTPYTAGETFSEGAGIILVIVFVGGFALLGLVLLAGLVGFIFK